MLGPQKKMFVKQDFTRRHDCQSLLEEDVRFCSATAPWVMRDLTKESCNTGQFRLMESSLTFLVRNKLLKDPNGEPFHWDIVYKDAGHTPALYVNQTFPQSFGGWFQIPAREYGVEKLEIEKFENSKLIPDPQSPYLNTKKKDVFNSIDEDGLRTVLSFQLGNLLNGNPFYYFENCANSLKTAWRYALFLALILHGHSNKLKDKAYEILDAMNYSLYSDGEILPENIDCSVARKTSFDFKELASDPAFVAMLSQHMMFENVFFMGLLNYTRRRGVLPTAMFGWVKALDRTLWYSLNQTGRSVACAEAAGVWSHYHAEEIMEKSIAKPYVEIAVDGFKQEMLLEGWISKNSKYEG